MGDQIVFLVTNQARHISRKIDRPENHSTFKCIYQGGNRDGKLGFMDSEIYSRFPKIEEIDGNHAVILHCGAPRPNSSTLNLFNSASIINNPHESQGRNDRGQKIYRKMDIKPKSKSVFYLYPAYQKQDWPDQTGAAIPIKEQLDILTKHYGIENIFTIDAHFAFDEFSKDYPIKNVSAKELMIDYAREHWVENFTVRGPDYGCSERMGIPGLPVLREGEFSKKIKEEYVNMEKLKSEIKGLPVLVVDDLLQTGKTAYAAGELYLKAGAPEIGLATTHIRLDEGYSRNVKENESAENGIYSFFVGTNTIDTPQAKVSVHELVMNTVGERLL